MGCPEVSCKRSLPCACSTFHVCIFTSAFLFLESVLDSELEGPKEQGLEMPTARGAGSQPAVGSQQHQNGDAEDVESENAPLVTASS